MRETALKPCPLCGGRAEWEYDQWNEADETGDDGMGEIRCTNCRLTLAGYDRDAAETLWNERSGGDTCTNNA